MSKKSARPPGTDVDNNFDFNTWIGDRFSEAVTRGASDVVLYTDADMRRMDCEIRINGDMHWMRRAAGSGVPSLVTVFRREADLATAGSPVPQEATYPVRMPDSGEIEMARAVVFKGHDGRFIAQLRLPSKDRAVTLEGLQLGDENFQRIREQLSTPGRMMMMAGPMGSGKTTTIHGMIDFVARDGTKTIWAIEDPVERALPGTFQLQADENNGYGFKEFLPHMVRSDYDTLFIGEIRDKETAAAAVRQSKAGRQILTTIHANDNIIALLRLIELAEDTPLAVLDSVKGVVSQRLVPTLNKNWDGVDASMKYGGRRPINEVLTVDRDIVQAFMDGMGLAELRRLVDDTGKSTTFFDDAARLVESGVTDWDAVGTVLGEYAVEDYLEAREKSAAKKISMSSPMAAEPAVERESELVGVGVSAGSGNGRNGHSSNGVAAAAASSASRPAPPAMTRTEVSTEQQQSPAADAPSLRPRPQRQMKKRLSASNSVMPRQRGDR